jgi:cell division ATPase FtsA
MGDDFENEEFEYLATDGETQKLSDSASICQEVIIYEIDRILSAIDSVLNANNCNIFSMPGGIILTGGGSKMRYMKEAFERFFEGVPVRIAKPLPSKVEGNKEIANNLSYTGAVGALHGILDVQDAASSKPKKSSFGLGQIFDSISKFFKEKL